MSLLEADLVPLDEVTFRKRFENAFKLDPSLTTSKYYEQLLDVDFDEQKALLRLRLSLARIRRPDEFLIPKSLAPQQTITEALPTSALDKRKVFDFLSESPTKNSTTVGSGKKRSAPHRPTEDSDDEPLIPGRSNPGINNRPILSPSKRSPHKIPPIFKDLPFYKELETDGDDNGGEKARPKKKHMARLPIRRSVTPTPSKSGNKKDATESSNHHPSSSVPSFMLITPATSNQKKLSFTPLSTKHNRKSSQAKTTQSSDEEVSDTVQSEVEEIDDGDDEESDEEYDTESEDSESVRLTTTPRKGQQSKDGKTQTTDWLNRLVSFPKDLG